MRNGDKRSTLKNSLFAISWQFRVAPLYTIFIFIWTLIGDIITLFEHTFMLAYIITCVEKSRPFYEILYFIIPVAIAATIKVTVGPFIQNYFYPKVEAKLTKDIHLKLYAKAAEMEISKYDDAKYYNDFVWAMQKAPGHITGTTDTFIQLVTRVVNALIAGTYIVATDSVALVVVALLLITTFVIEHFLNKLKMKCEEDMTPVERKRDYVNRVFYLAEYIKDLKMSNMAEKLERDYCENSEMMEKLVGKHGKRIGGLNLLRGGTNNLIYDGGYLTYLFYQALVAGNFGLGSLLALYNSASRLNNNLRRLIMMLPGFQWHSMYIQKLRTFLETENEMQDGDLEISENGDIVLDNVCFTYPGNEEPTIKGISMRIGRGEKIALVGFNGAGKSTLIKLILRLYDTDSGNIAFGGTDVRDFKITEYRKQFGVLFQNFEIIAADVGTNINMSDDELNIERADAVLKKTAFWERFQTLPDGYKTQLTKEFDEKGINLSGGEAQKIALARVLYADSDVIILDEPSSALDPIAEYQLNKTVTELAGDKTVIIISHRLSTTRFVDKIFMLEDGQIIEQGNHEALLSKNGKYAEMFKLQAEKYR